MSGSLKVTNEKCFLYSEEAQFSNAKIGGLFIASVGGVTALAVGILTLLQPHAMAHIGVVLSPHAIYGILTTGGVLLLGSGIYIIIVHRRQNKEIENFKNYYNNNKAVLESEFENLTSRCWTELEAGEEAIIRLVRVQDENCETRFLQWCPNRKMADDDIAEDSNLFTFQKPSAYSVEELWKKTTFQ